MSTLKIKLGPGPGATDAKLSVDGREVLAGLGVKSIKIAQYADGLPVVYLECYADEVEVYKELDESVTVQLVEKV